MVLEWIIGSTILVSLISFIGILTFSLKGDLLNKVLLFLVALSAGALMGGAFLHLIPEAIEASSSANIFIYILAGFILFFLVEKVLHWRHCHEEHCKVHAFVYMNLLGDSIHNFIDGLIIAASFTTNFQLGIATTFAVIIHEIPQEIGDFGVLIYGGFERKKALMFNFLTALTAVLGGILGYYLSSLLEFSTLFLLPFAAGGFIYIAASDLIPELKKETSMKRSLPAFITFVIGIALMYILKTFVSV